jgi:predicted kinase
MLSGHYFNPDDHLETDAGRVFTAELNAAAFDRAHAELEDALRKAPPGARLFVVVGVQGAGKTTWVQRNAEQLGPNSFFFEAALPRAVHRARAVAIAKDCGVPAVAVWVQASLEVALARNELRRVDHRAPEVAIRSVNSIMEPPSTAEGFADIKEVRV